MVQLSDGPVAGSVSQNWTWSTWPCASVQHVFALLAELEQLRTELVGQLGLVAKVYFDNPRSSSEAIDREGIVVVMVN